MFGMTFSPIVTQPLDRESGVLKKSWTPACADMTVWGLFARPSNLRNDNRRDTSCKGKIPLNVFNYFNDHNIWYLMHIYKSNVWEGPNMVSIKKQGKSFKSFPLCVSYNNYHAPRAP